MVTAAIDVHKQVLQAVVLEGGTGAVVEERFGGREALADWAMRWRGKLSAVAVAATTGWRWVARELQASGFDVRLVDRGQAKALQGRKRRAKTDRLDARWLCLLLAKQMLPEAWLPPAEIQELRDRTRLRKALVDDRTRWAQRLHALLTQEGWPCRRKRLLTRAGRWASSLVLGESAAAQVGLYLRLLETLDVEVAALESELRRFARQDRRCRAPEGIFGVGPILACHLLAEIGDAHRFRRARQITQLAGLDPVVEESADSRRRGKLARQGPPTLRWALVQAAQHAPRTTSPDRALYTAVERRCGSQRAKLTVAPKIGRRAYHLLRQLDQQDQAA
jgi:transposase